MPETLTRSKTAAAEPVAAPVPASSRGDVSNADWQNQFLPFVSRLDDINGWLLDALQREVLSDTIEWHEPYSEYASAGLQVAVLLSPDGQQENFSWKDCRDAKATPLLNRLPVLKQLLEDFGFDIMASRLLRLLPGTFLHEHRDYVYLEQVPRYRLHVPIVTNADAHIIIPGQRIHMSRGCLWKLNPKESIHSACNFGSEPRIHLMLDCYVNDKLEALVQNETLPSCSVSALPLFTPVDKERILRKAMSLLESNKLSEAEDLVLAQFCHFNLEQVTTYDLVHDLFRTWERRRLAGTDEIPEYSEQNWERRRLTCTDESPEYSEQNWERRRLACTDGNPNYSERLEYWRKRAEEVYPVINH